METGDVQIAYDNFWDDLYQVMLLHDRLMALAEYAGQDKNYDQGLLDLVERQKQIMFDLRTLYAEIYESLNSTQIENIGTFIQKAGKDLESLTPTVVGLGSLGIAPIILAGGIVLSAIAAGAVLAFHRNISLQAKRIEYQEGLVPLVEQGKLPSDILLPATESSKGLFGWITDFGNIIALGLAGALVVPIVRDAVRKKK